MPRRRLLLIGLSFAINVFISSTVLPVVLSPFRLWTPSELVEVLLWQGMAAAGWPAVILGGLFAILFGSELLVLLKTLYFLIYPMTMGLLVLSAVLRPPRRWAIPLALAHVLTTLSFAVLWHSVLNGYDFMIG